MKSVGDLSQVCSQIVLKCVYLARIGRPDILWSVNKLARSITKSTKACDKRQNPLISYIHHTCEYRQYIVMWVKLGIRAHHRTHSSWISTETITSHQTNRQRDLQGLSTSNHVSCPPSHLSCYCLSQPELSHCEHSCVGKVLGGLLIPMKVTMEMDQVLIEQGDLLYKYLEQFFKA